METLEKNEMYDNFDDMLDCADWSGARHKIVLALQNNEDKLAKRLQERYKARVCEECDGVGSVNDGQHDTFAVKDCICQIEV